MARKDNRSLAVTFLSRAGGSLPDQKLIPKSRMKRNLVYRVYIMALESKWSRRIARLCPTSENRQYALTLDGLTVLTVVRGTQRVGKFL